MAVDTRPSYQVRNAPQSTFTTPYLNRRGELVTGHGLPPLANTVALKNSWYAKTSTAAAPLTALPTTAYKIALWNGDSTKWYVMDSAFVTVVADTAAIQNVSLLGNVSAQAVLTALANTITPKPMFANQAYAGSARIDVATTIDSTSGVAVNWQTLGNSVGSASLSVGCSIDVDLKGGIILPPNGLFALTAIGGAATATSIQLGFRWHEVDPIAY
jgi:hypothetical protein